MDFVICVADPTLIVFVVFEWFVVKPILSASGSCGVGFFLLTEIDRILSMIDFSGMQTINYTDARNQLATLMEAASRDREPITITRNGAGKVVMLAIEEYEAMETTLHLYSTRANATQIQESLADYASGRIQAGELCD